MKVLRKIIQIDEELCDGCGQCVPDCAEGSLQIINGKARLVAVENNMIEDVQDGTVTGEPEQYSRYADKIRLYPIPAAVYTMSMSYIYKLTELAQDADTNAWMTECEELIR